MRNSQHHNPYSQYDYCAACCCNHPVGVHPEEGETEQQFIARLKKLESDWDKEYRAVESAKTYRIWCVSRGTLGLQTGWAKRDGEVLESHDYDEIKAIADRWNKNSGLNQSYSVQEV